MEVQGVGILLEILAIAGIGGIRRRADIADEPASRSLVETFLEVLAGLSGARFAGGLVGNRPAIRCGLIEQ